LPEGDLGQFEADRLGCKSRYVQTASKPKRSMAFLIMSIEMT
jgi:hypothetical protein